MSYAFAWEEEAIASLLLTLFTGIPSGIFGVVCYVLRSMALYTIAQRRQIRNAWLAWVPVLSCWILGSLSDQYRYVVKGQIKAKRKWLIGLNIAKLILGTAAFILALLALGDALHYGDFAQPFLKSLFRTLIFGLPVACIGVAVTVIRFMALYDVYMSLEPENAILFLVLSILIKIVEPFFLFFSREKDLGMPPRRDTVPPVQEQHYKDYL